MGWRDVGLVVEVGQVVVAFGWHLRWLTIGGSGSMRVGICLWRIKRKELSIVSVRLQRWSLISSGHLKGRTKQESGGC